MSRVGSTPWWLRLLGGALVVVIAVAGWWLQAGPNSSGDDGTDASRTGVDPYSGLPWVSVDDLPPEAEHTLELIDDGGPFPYERDGITFGNFEGLLPQRERGWYAEYTVETPGLSHRGARRIVTGGDDEYYWTDDHYDSFERVDR